MSYTSDKTSSPRDSLCGEYKTLKENVFQYTN